MTREFITIHEATISHLFERGKTTCRLKVCSRLYTMPLFLKPRSRTLNPWAETIFAISVVFGIQTMALYSILRRASSSVIPLAIRTVGSSRAIHGAVSTVLTVQKGNLSRELTRRSFVPFLRFSTETAAKHKADENLIRVLESELQCAEESEGHNSVSSSIINWFIWYDFFFFYRRANSHIKVTTFCIGLLLMYWSRVMVENIPIC